ncbi:hypothetical protein BLNAU_18548 [Blattamonas nauphoetae]|uniref:Uncharacterized protein n=1 Tax=Blattamonas nauphoetae TaxID=2049346 RepID=A0ABQ9X406_9EUKA|nr:hypothetical protein BLNAU_18548 [Blattamonas nauphoetae]
MVPPSKRLSPSTCDNNCPVILLGRFQVIGRSCPRRIPIEETQQSRSLVAAFVSNLRGELLRIKHCGQAQFDNLVKVVDVNALGIEKKMGRRQQVQRSAPSSQIFHLSSAHQTH